MAEGDDDDDFDELAEEGDELLEAVGLALDAFEELELGSDEGARGALARLERDLEDGELPLESRLRGEDGWGALQRLVREALIDAAAALPALQPSSDGGTPAAIDAVTRRFGTAVPTDALMRIMEHAETPQAVLALLFQAVTLEDDADTQHAVDCVIELWNRTPRRHLGGHTPAQVTG